MNGTYLIIHHKTRTYHRDMFLIQIRNIFLIRSVQIRQLDYNVLILMYYSVKLIDFRLAKIHKPFWLFSNYQNKENAMQGRILLSYQLNIRILEEWNISDIPSQEIYIF